jgi:hypothetical protein
MTDLRSALEPRPFDFGLRLGKSGSFALSYRRQIADQPLQRDHIIRQSNEIDVHE